MLRNKWVLLALTFVLLFVTGGPVLYWKEKYGGGLVTEVREAETLQKLNTVQEPKDSYDVIVVGTDPEGVAAAVSASRNGLKTLLVDGKEREILGGLMTLGWLNMIDLNQDKDDLTTFPGSKPAVHNKGIFQEWFDRVEGTSFDITTGTNAFHELVAKEQNLEVVLKASSIEPIVAAGADGLKKVEGINLTLSGGAKKSVKAGSVVDATQDADIAAAAGVPFTVGREDLGDPKSRMAVTVVFRLKNADAAFWQEVRKRLENDDNHDTGADEYSAWGYGEMQKYPSVNKERLKMRGLNIGRQNDETILINALQIFGIDPLDPASRAEAYKLAEDELPHVLEHMKKLYPEFANLELAGMAPELYVRETRHMQGLYRLTILDVLENRDQWDAIAYGSYRVDLQRTSPTDNGAEILAPHKYAVPFRSLVPQEVDGILVVGRSASYDTLPHGSARVIPTGMAEGQAAGAAAKLALENKLSFRKLAESKELIAELQKRLNEQKMKIEPYTVKKQPYQEHKAYEGLKAAVYMGITAGGGTNDFKLDEASNPQRFVNHFLTAKKVFGTTVLKGDPNAAVGSLSADEKKGALTLRQAAYTMARTVGLNVAADKAEQELTAKGLIKSETLALIADKQKLTNGEAYLLLKDLLQGTVNVRF